MKVSGFTIIRNAVQFGYPAAESIRSILPLCDEVVVNYGISDDGTEDLLNAVDSPKIKIIKSEWDMAMRDGGKLLSAETNRALDACSGDWCLYIQADEVLHEKYYSEILAAMKKYHHINSVEGLCFGYEHFYGSYGYVQDNFRLWYLHEVRLIKNHRNIRSWGDAMGFKHADGTKIKSIRIKPKIYHYGWVRPPSVMKTKKENLETMYHSDAEIAAIKTPENVYIHLGHLLPFKGSHPEVMKDRILQHNWYFDAQLETQLPRFIRYIILFFEPLSKRVRRHLNDRTAK